MNPEYYRCSRGFYCLRKLDDLGNAYYVDENKLYKLEEGDYAYVYYKILLFFLREKNKWENINQSGQWRGAASIPKDVYFIKN